ncbi:MAG: hypothetical protein ACFB10_08465 [Salibacteraceae bacterium]
MMIRLLVVCGWFFVAVACQPDKNDFTPRNATDERYEALRSTLVSEIELQSTEQYLTDLPALTNSVKVSSSVEHFLETHALQPYFFNRLSRALDELKADGFVNLEHSEVWQNNRGEYYFAAFRPVPSSQPLRDMRLTIIQENIGGTGGFDIGWLAGPDLVGVVSTLRYLKAQGISNQELHQVLYPYGVLYTSTLSFGNSLEYSFDYLTARGTAQTSHRQEEYVHLGIRQNCSIVRVVFTGGVFTSGTSVSLQDVSINHTWVFPN